MNCILIIKVLQNRNILENHDITQSGNKHAFFFILFLYFVIYNLEINVQLWSDGYRYKAIPNVCEGDLNHEVKCSDTLIK